MARPITFTVNVPSLSLPMQTDIAEDLMLGQTAVFDTVRGNLRRRAATFLESVFGSSEIPSAILHDTPPNSAPRYDFDAFAKGARTWVALVKYMSNESLLLLLYSNETSVRTTSRLGCFIKGSIEFAQNRKPSPRFNADVSIVSNGTRMLKPIIGAIQYSSNTEYAVTFPDWHPDFDAIGASVVIPSTPVVTPAVPTNADNKEITMSATNSAVQINDQIKQIINGVLGSANISTTIDELLTSHAAIPSMEQTINGFIKRLHDTESDLKTAQSQLAQAIVSAQAVQHVSINANTNMGTPNGKTETRNACDIFPELGTKAKFDVPFFVWDFPHPQVPKLNPHYQPDVKALRTLLLALINNEPFWLHGHTGTGKTSLVEYVCAKLNWCFDVISLDGDISRAELIGTKDLTTDANGNPVTIFSKGKLPQAIETPTVLLLDEQDFGRSDVMYVLQRVLEGKSIDILENAGERLVRHPYARLGGTANTKGTGDETGLYSGAKIQTEAYRNRFTKWARVNYITSDAELSLLNAQGLNDTLGKQIVGFANAVRAAFMRAEIGNVVTPRNTVALAKSIMFHSTYMTERQAINQALQETIIESCSDDFAQKIIELAGTHLGFDPSSVK